MDIAPQQPIKHTKSLVITIVAVLVTAGVVGGLVYWYLTQGFNTEKSSLEGRVNDLQLQVQKLGDSGVSGWKTYTDATHGFSIKYPDAWYAFAKTSDQYEKMCEAALDPNMQTNCLGDHLVVDFNSVNAFCTKESCVDTSLVKTANPGSLQTVVINMYPASQHADTIKSIPQKATHTTVRGIDLYESPATSDGPAYIRGYFTIGDTDFVINSAQETGTETAEIQVVKQMAATFSGSLATSSNPTQTSDLNTYTNSDLGFSIQYPDGQKPTQEMNDQYNRLTEFGAPPSAFFEVRLQKDDDVNMGVKYGFLDSVVQSTSIKVNDLTAYKAVSTTGYGDAGVQGQPFVDFGIHHSGDVYHILFYGDATISDQEQRVLDSFEFTK